MGRTDDDDEWGGGMDGMYVHIAKSNLSAMCVVDAFVSVCSRQ